jgi:hypothetical protein
MQKEPRRPPFAIVAYLIPVPYVQTSAIESRFDGLLETHQPALGPSARGVPSRSFDQPVYIPSIPSSSIPSFFHPWTTSLDYFQIVPDLIITRSFPH